MVVQAKKAVPAKETSRPSPTPNVNKIASLKRYSDKDYALDLLHQITRAVAPIIHKYKFRVGTLCEMFPKNPNLLGLNVNRGQKILIRLRAPHNDRSFFPIGDLIGTFLHELTHNVHGPHDAKFYSLLDELKTTYETSAYSSSDYVCEENKLGKGYVAPWADPKSIRQKRLQALSRGTYKAESRRVGGNGASLKDLRKLTLQAAERRLRDSKWCTDSKDTTAISDTDDLHYDQPSSHDSATGSTLDSASSQIDVKHVIDLTADEVDDDGIEIITVDACEASSDQNRKGISASGRDSSHHKLQCETTHSFVSHSSGKTFIGESWRRKIVVNMDFEHLINQELEKCMRAPSPRLSNTYSMTEKLFVAGRPKTQKSSRSKSPSPGSSEKQMKGSKLKGKRSKKAKRTKCPSPSLSAGPRVKKVRTITFEDLLAE